MGSASEVFRTGHGRGAQVAPAALVTLAARSSTRLGTSALALLAAALVAPAAAGGPARPPAKIPQQPGAPVKRQATGASVDWGKPPSMKFIGLDGSASVPNATRQREISCGFLGLSSPRMNQPRAADSRRRFASMLIALGERADALFQAGRYRA